MQHKIDMLAVVTNYLAMELTLKEYFQNEQAIKKEGVLVHESCMFEGKSDFGEDCVKMEEKSESEKVMPPSELVLEMAELGTFGLNSYGNQREIRRSVQIGNQIHA